MITDIDLAIVLSGGGSRGAFQVGVLDALVQRSGLKVGLYAGISTGAIQALGAAQDRITDLRETWLALKGDSSVYRKRPLGMVGAFLFGRNSLYDAAPIRERIRDFHDQAALEAAGKGLSVGTVNLRTGELTYVNETTPDLAEWTIASAAVPATYQPLVDTEGDQWVDGGVRDITPLGAVLARRPKAVLVILAQNRRLGAGAGKAPYDGILDIGLRAVSILTDEVFQNDIANAERINGLLGAIAEQRLRLQDENLDPVEIDRVMQPLEARTQRYNDVPIAIIEPAATYPLPGSTDFDPAAIRDLMAHGEDVAMADATGDLIADLKRRARIS
ncbi:hypothetical protein B5C34_13735 [Pacificimonas flava]|uniref:PNPLA domain-containing protein n=2 Tax=Pacificimonas TaxID=1960290 RepID=A0A219B8A5_9SPHN|nr:MULTISPECIES: patatin-like phospholipase family protein [Pacificimonas]MBZ6379886.1 patatin-like phospholipase family protein [Pacificimonas aurantium]OWV34414.1 hypothetical protein B5C34_13735 [Pacificimonas flava]